MTIPGDINQDGKLDRTDLNILRQLIQQASHADILNMLTPDQLRLLDVNHDGQIDQDDIDALCKQLLNSSHPSGQQLTEQFNALRSKAGQ